MGGSEFYSRERFSRIFGPFRFRSIKCKCVILVLKDFNEETELNNKHVYSGFYVELLSQTLTQTVSFSIFPLIIFLYFSSLFLCMCVFLESYFYKTQLDSFTYFFCDVKLLAGLLYFLFFFPIKGVFDMSSAEPPRNSLS